MSIILISLYLYISSLIVVPFYKILKFISLNIVFLLVNLV